ncbi:MAG: outer membrane protein transport protein [Acidobacteriota bacterium]
MTTLKKGLLTGLCFVLITMMVGANGLNLNSLGSRALAMGGAFVGLADDFSAAFWNPAGMAQFTKKTFGIYGADLIPSMTYNLSMGPLTLVNAETENKNYLAGMAAYYHPVNDFLVAGVSLYMPSGLGANWTGSDFSLLTAGQAYKWESKVGMVTVAPGFGIKVNDKLKIGATLNINHAVFDLFTHAGDELFDMGQQSINLTGWGFGATIGALYKATDRFSVGASLRLPTKVKFSGTTEIQNLSLLGQVPTSPLFGAQISNTTDTEATVTWPFWMGIGLAFKPLDNLTLTADFHYTDWKSIDVIDLDFTDQYWRLITAQNESDKFSFLWQSVSQIRFGGEYVFGKNIAVRAGYYWDPSPAPDKTMNVLLPSFDFNVFTFGFGYTTAGLTIDVGFECLMGKDRDVDPYPTLLDAENMFGLYTMKIFVPTISLNYGW